VIHCVAWVLIATLFRMTLPPLKEALVVERAKGFGDRR
jgi:hypothetical protein